MKKLILLIVISTLLVGSAFALPSSDIMQANEGAFVEQQLDDAESWRELLPWFWLCRHVEKPAGKCNPQTNEHKVCVTSSDNNRACSFKCECSDSGCSWNHYQACDGERCSTQNVGECVNPVKTASMQAWSNALQNIQVGQSQPIQQ